MEATTEPIRTPPRQAAAGRLIGIGALLQFCHVTLRHDLFPDHHPYGHWFWIGLLGGLLCLTGLILDWIARSERPDPDRTSLLPGSSPNPPA